MHHHMRIVRPFVIRHWQIPFFLTHEQIMNTITFRIHHFHIVHRFCQEWISIAFRCFLPHDILFIIPFKETACILEGELFIILYDKDTLIAYIILVQNAIMHSLKYTTGIIFQYLSRNQRVMGIYLKTIVANTTAWVTTSFPQHLPNKSKLRKAWFSSILSDFSLQITCCLEYFVYFCIEIHLFRKMDVFVYSPCAPFSPPYRTTRHQLGTRKAPPSGDLARAYYI